MISPEHGFRNYGWGLRPPYTPKTINAAAPDGAPLRRIKTVEIIICRFHGLGVNTLFMPGSPERAMSRWLTDEHEKMYDTFSYQQKFYKKMN
jgi:hypothetical protein